MHELLVLVLFVLWHLLLFFAYTINTRLPALDDFWSFVPAENAAAVSFSLIVLYIIIHLLLLTVNYSWHNCACVCEESQCKCSERRLMGTSCPFLHRKILWDIAREVRTISLSHDMLDVSTHFSLLPWFLWFIQVYSGHSVAWPFLILRLAKMITVNNAKKYWKFLCCFFFSSFYLILLVMEGT